MRLPQYKKTSFGLEDFGDKIMKTPQTKDIAEMLQDEIARCLSLLSQYASRGASGLRDHTIVSNEIISANSALLALDSPRMAISLKTLEGVQLQPISPRNNVPARFGPNTRLG